MKNSHLPLSILLGFTCSLVGNLRGQSTSEQWRQAVESRAARESALTNGMAWPATEGVTETVMSPGMTITATNSEGVLTISAGEGTERSYTWNNETRSAKLWPRKKRWYGSLGLYYPGPDEHWKPNAGITRGVLDEGVLWFKTEKDMLAWIDFQQLGERSIYSDDGLLVFWMKNSSRQQLTVQVWQIMVAGSKPKALRGSRNSQIVVTKPRGN